MADVILSIAVVVGTYLGSAVFAIALFKIFFPLKKKDVKQLRLTYSYSGNKSPQSTAKNKIQFLSGGGRRDLLKVSS